MNRSDVNVYPCARKGRSFELLKQLILRSRTRLVFIERVLDLPVQELEEDSFALEDVAFIKNGLESEGLTV